MSYRHSTSDEQLLSALKYMEYKESTMRKCSEKIDMYRQMYTGITLLYTSETNPHCKINYTPTEKKTQGKVLEIIQALLHLDELVGLILEGRYWLFPVLPVASRTGREVLFHTGLCSFPDVGR